MLDKLRTALVLLIIGAISGILIFGTNELTFDDILQNRIDAENNYYREIFDIDDSVVLKEELIKNELTGDLNQEVLIETIDGTLLGYVYRGSETNQYGDITVLIGINLDGKISQVVISNTTNTPNNVKKIEKNNLDPFSGQDTDDLLFDTKTGSSYTYGSVSKFVQAASDYYNSNRGDE